jgi:gliding motility-associated-like protein
MKYLLWILAIGMVAPAQAQLTAGFSSSANLLVCDSTCINFTDLTTGGTPTSWQWSFPGANPSSSTDQHPANICYDLTGVYDVTLIVSDGVDSDTLELTAYIVQACVRQNGFFIPTAFSPNGDGSNEVLYVRGNNISRLQFVVYDRWGAKMFESTDPGRGWDGNFNGEKAAAGVYSYVAVITFADGNSEKLAGQTTLIR